MTGEFTDEEGRLCSIACHGGQRCILRFVLEEGAMDIYYLNAAGEAGEHVRHEGVLVADCTWNNQRWKDPRPKKRARLRKDRRGG
jgi:hypothetical protein